ncbi:MAG: hypothetical protein HYW25_00920 [Candidatus Aenigmarchaeota archaeon]|nr:hypothetical protein [Candidatus Aenigmarchaeota archaeon]
MALAIKGVVIIVMAALVIAVLTYFLLSGLSFFDRATLEKEFRSGCAAICSNPDRASINLAREYPSWLNACENLYGVEEGAYLVCLENCGGGCVVRGNACDYLQSFRPVIDNWLDFCRKVREHPATRETYGSCEC